MDERPTDQEVADVLEAVRVALGISVREQARRAKVSPSTMSRWCSEGPLKHPMSQHRPKAERYLADVADMDAKTPGEKRARALAADLMKRIEAALTSAAEAADVADQVAEIEDQGDQQPTGTDE